MAVELIDDAAFTKELQTNEKVVVKYYADWCGSCRLFSPKFKRLSNDERFVGVRFIDVNAEESPDARKAANVTNLPYFAVFKNGRFLEGASTNKEDMVIELIGKLN